jgi:hypothetical protein
MDLGPLMRRLKTFARPDYLRKLKLWFYVLQMAICHINTLDGPKLMTTIHGCPNSPKRRR